MIVSERRGRISAGRIGSDELGGSLGAKAYTDFLVRRMGELVWKRSSRARPIPSPPCGDTPGMKTIHGRIGLAATLLAAGLGAGCQSGGVGDPCTPEEEYQPTFAGFSETEVNFESRSFQCETRLCLVNHFRGRVSCPYGQSDPSDPDSVFADESFRCHVPGTSGEADRVAVQVRPQLLARRADDTVYCSCRCGGDDPNAKYCDCPSGYACAELMKDVRLGSKELAGSYCVKEGTQYDPNAARGGTCDRKAATCGAPDGT